MSYFNTITKILATGLRNTFPAQLSTISETVFSNTIETIINSNLPKPMQLDSTAPDYESLLLQMMNEVEKNPEWQDTIVSGTGQSLLRFIAAMGALELYAIERATQEVFSDTANNPTSILRIARMHGVHITRKRPAFRTVVLRRTPSYTNLLWQIPPYTEFLIDGDTFFSRDTIIFNIDELETTATLYQGEMKQSVVLSSGVINNRIEIGEERWDISDLDVLVSIDGVPWKRSIEGLWNFDDNDKVFYENTLPNGNVELAFGDDNYGAAPPANKEITITWIATNGRAGNDSRSNLEVTLKTDNPNIVLDECNTTSPAINGDNERDPTFYRLTSPHIYAARRRMVRRSDYAAVTINEYPTVLDAVFRGQAETHPDLRSWTNIVAVTLLTDPVWGGTEWDAFVKWLNDEKGIFKVEYLRQDPVQVPLNITATVLCKSNANLDVIKQTIQRNFDAAFELRRGSIGYSWYKSDLMAILEGSDDIREYISHAILTLPTEDVEVDSLEYVKLNSLTLTVEYTTRGGYVGRRDL